MNQQEKEKLKAKARAKFYLDPPLIKCPDEYNYHLPKKNPIDFFFSYRYPGHLFVCFFFTVMSLSIVPCFINLDCLIKKHFPTVNLCPRVKVLNNQNKDSYREYYHPNNHKYRVKGVIGLDSSQNRKSDKEDSCKCTK